MNLEETAITLVDQFGSVRDASSKSIDRFFNNLGKVAFGGFGAVVMIGIGYLLLTILTRFILDGSQIAFGVFLMLFIVFAALSLVYVIYNESKKDDQSAKRAVTSDLRSIPELSGPDTGKLLSEPSHMPIPSVIENTTDLLTVESKTRKL